MYSTFDQKVIEKHLSYGSKVPYEPNSRQTRRSRKRLRRRGVRRASRRGHFVRESDEENNGVEQGGTDDSEGDTIQDQNMAVGFVLKSDIV